MQTIKEIRDAIRNATMFAEGATSILEHQGHLEWDIWLWATKVEPIHTINLFCNGVGRPQATLYKHTPEGIDLDTALDLFY
jgi:hypothetical protein